MRKPALGPPPGEGPRAKTLPKNKTSILIVVRDKKYLTPDKAMIMCRRKFMEKGVMHGKDCVCFYASDHR